MNNILQQENTMNNILHEDMAQQLKDAFPSPDEIPEDFRLSASSYIPCYLLDGKVRSWDGPLAAVYSPICLKQNNVIKRPIIGQVPAMNESTTLAALDAARRAWNNGRGDWPQMSFAARIEAVEAFVALMLKSREEIIKLLMWEIGKNLEESRAEFDRTVDYIRLTVEVLKDADRIGMSFRQRGDMVARVGSAPVGVCLLMGPFNNPLYETYTMLIPALLMGNTTIVKAPKFGVILHQILFQPLADCFPPGVINFVYGADNGADNISVLMRTGHIDVFSFIGSAGGAAALVHRHPRLFRLRSILSLEAKNSALIMADADMDRAVRECVVGALGFNGQRCTALKILFVHESVVDEFLKEFCDAVNALPIGMPWHKGVKLTPLPEFGKVRSMTAYVDDAVAKGGSVVNRNGGTACGTLFFPAIVYPVAKTSELYRKEQFGPVVPVCPYGDYEEFLDFVVASDYGQQVSLFGRNPDKIAKLAGYLENQVCRINLNCKCQRGPDMLPFTGRKDSGMTTLSISDTLGSFSVPSVIAVRSGSEGPAMIRQIATNR
jgi:glyceraldehyde-3-phosphate dehydrogenase (NADP+)